MEGTAINTPQWESSMSSRFADSSLETTARSDSIATIMLGKPIIYFPRGTTIEPTSNVPPLQHMGTMIQISPKEFDFFVETIANPPSPNPKLAQLLSSDSL